MKTKLVIVDPCCYPTGGHNFDACLRYARFYEKEFDEIELWLAGDRNLISRSEFKTEVLPRLYVQLFADKFQTRFEWYTYTLFMRFFRMIFGKILDSLLLKIASGSIKKLIKKNRSFEVTLYFPSADLYFCKAALDLSEKKKIKLKKLMLRFIGVMEYSSRV